MKYHLLAATALSAVSLGFAGTAAAVPIALTFNFVPTGSFVATGPTNNDITVATGIAGGGPFVTTVIVTNNVGLVAGAAISFLPTTLPTAFGSNFTKTFVTTLGTFVESLTIDLNTPGATSLAISAHGTIHESVVLSGALLDDAPVFYSAAYTQNNGPGAQINGSFNDSTTPPPPPPTVRSPEPASMAVLGIGLAGLAAARRRKR